MVGTKASSRSWYLESSPEMTDQVAPVLTDDEFVEPVEAWSLLSGIFLFWQTPDAHLVQRCYRRRNNENTPTPPPLRFVPIFVSPRTWSVRRRCSLRANSRIRPRRIRSCPRCACRGCGGCLRNHPHPHQCGWRQSWVRRVVRMPPPRFPSAGGCAGMRRHGLPASSSSSYDSY